MIKYALLCANGHEFESWFSDSASYANLSSKHLVACPACATTDVEKALMAPNISAKSNAAPAPAPAPDHNHTKPGSAHQNVLVLAARVAKQLKHDADNVGDKFADEARRIHYREAPERAIWGKATSQETRDLIEEGIGVIALPPSPEDHN